MLSLTMDVVVVAHICPQIGMCGLRDDAGDHVVDDDVDQAAFVVMVIHEIVKYLNVT